MSPADTSPESNGWDSLPARPAWMPGAVREILEADPHPPTGRRTNRDITIDVLMVLLAAGIGSLTIGGRVENWGPLLAADIAVGLLGCVALVWRRRWPFAIALILTVASGFASFITGPAFLALFSLAVHRPLRYSLAIGVLGIGAAMSNYFLYPDAEQDTWPVVLAFSVLLTVAALGWGTMVRNRRQLLISLAELARNVESEQRERIAHARATERERLAREMHDVLAHRMSLLSVHAGALEFRPDASPEEISRAAGVIRAGVHQMLVDLRDVIGMLREETDDDLAAPTRALATIAELFDEAELAGSPMKATIDIADVDMVPGVVSRAAYRIVQEGLTNARKHAGAVPVTVRIDGAPGHGLTVTISQPLNAGLHPPSIPGTGSGLVGLNERVTLAGGTLEHSIIDRNFVLTARLPWEEECPR